jgi:hypothetical protein
MQDFYLGPGKAPRPSRKTKKCDPSLLKRAWDYFWHPVFRNKADAMVKMQWEALREAIRTDTELRPHAVQIAAGFSYMFGRYTKHCTDQGLTVPIYPLIAAIPGTPEERPRRLALFEEIFNTPRPTGAHTKIHWKLSAKTPEAISEFGRSADVIFKQELMSAQARAIQRLKGV